MGTGRCNAYYNTLHHTLHHTHSMQIQTCDILILGFWLRERHVWGFSETVSLLFFLCACLLCSSQGTCDTSWGAAKTWWTETLLLSLLSFFASQDQDQAAKTYCNFGMAWLWLCSVPSFMCWQSRFVVCGHRTAGHSLEPAGCRRNILPARAIYQDLSKNLIASGVKESLRVREFEASKTFT